MKQNPLKRVIAWLDLHLEETILIITGSLIGIVIMMQIIMRYVFRHALPWPEEFCRFCYIYFCFISLGYAVRNRCLLNITLLQDHPPRVLRMALDILIQVSMLIVFIIFFGGSIDCVKATIISGQRSPALQIPMTIPYLATSIGFFLAIIRSVQSSFQSIKLLLTGGDIKVDAMTAVEEELDEASQQLFRNQKGGN